MFSNLAGVFGCKLNGIRRIKSSWTCPCPKWIIRAAYREKTASALNALTSWTWSGSKSECGNKRTEQGETDKYCVILSTPTWYKRNFHVRNEWTNARVTRKRIGYKPFKHVQIVNSPIWTHYLDYVLSSTMKRDQIYRIAYTINKCPFGWAWEDKSFQSIHLNVWLVQMVKTS